MDFAVKRKGAEIVEPHSGHYVVFVAVGIIIDIFTV